jgi:hypothetical protein
VLYLRRCGASPVLGTYSALATVTRISSSSSIVRSSFCILRLYILTVFMPINRRILSLLSLSMVSMASSIMDCSLAARPWNVLNPSFASLGLLRVTVRTSGGRGVVVVVPCMFGCSTGGGDMTVFVPVVGVSRVGLVLVVLDELSGDDRYNGEYGFVLGDVVFFGVGRGGILTVVERVVDLFCCSFSVG